MLAISLVSFLAVVVAIKYWTTHQLLTEARSEVNRLVIRNNALSGNYQSLNSAHNSVVMENMWRREMLAQIAALVTRRPPRRRWLAISKHVAAIAVEGYNPVTRSMSPVSRAHWLAAAERERA